MRFESIKEEVVKLNSHHRIIRWVQLLSGLILCISGVYLVEVSYNGSKFKFVNDLASGKAYLLLSPLGGSLIGSILSRWSGSKELNLLNKIVQSGKGM